MDNAIPHIYVNGRIAYFSQSSHIFTRSVRDNITFGKVFDPEKYNRIVEMCCLKTDFDLLAAGDKTEIGGKGVNLSGGQKARIALARVLYSDADIVLLDDPLSAVDSHVGKTIWNDAVLGYLKQRGTTVLIASHQTQYFNDCDRVIQIINGKIEHFDTVPNLMDQGVKIMGITGETTQTSTAMTNLKSNPVNSQQKPDSEEVHGALKDYDASKAKTITEENVTKAGTVTFDTYAKWCKSGAIGLGILTLILLVIAQAATQYQTILISHWSQDKYGWTKKEKLNLDAYTITLSDCGRGKHGVPNVYCESEDAMEDLMFNSNADSGVDFSLRG